MRTHYLPMEYLRRFSVEGRPDIVWRYDKRLREFKSIGVVNAGVYNDFYSSEDERWLTEVIEGPAQGALNSLRNGERIGPEGRLAVSRYVESLTKRVPAARQGMVEFLCEEANRLLEDIRRHPEQHAKLSGIPADEISRLAEEYIAGKFNETLSLAGDVARRQWSNPLVASMISSMDWTVLSASPSRPYLTGDRPVFLPDGGIRAPHFQGVTMPLSTTAALHLRPRRPGYKPLAHTTANDKQVKEINRRTIHRSDRYLFMHQELFWVRSVAENPVPRWTHVIK